MTFLPSLRLIRLGLLVVVVAVAAGPLPELGALWLAAAGAWIVVALADLGLSLGRHAPPAITLPAVVRLTKDRPGKIPLTLANPESRERRLRIGIGLPAGFADEHPDLAVEVPAGARAAVVEWTTTAARRGRYPGVVVCCESSSRLGLWNLRTRTVSPCEVRVYPNLFSERRQLAAIFLNHGQNGSKVQRTVGRGREFEKLREYQPGDSYDEIDWKATARRGHPVTRVFQAEKTQEIYVVVDLSRLSARRLVHEGREQTVLERHLTAASVLLLAAEREGDRFGFVAYDDRVRVFLRAGKGAGHYAACREALHALQPGEGTADMAEVVRHLRTQLRSRALLFFLTDLGDPVLAEDFTRHAPMLARQHLVLVNQLRAPGVAPLFTGDEVAEPAEVYARLAGHLRWGEARTLMQVLKPHGITVTLLEDETLAAQLVTQYLQVKRRQLL